jgi:hypothetical protein
MHKVGIGQTAVAAITVLQHFDEVIHALGVHGAGDQP